MANYRVAFTDSPLPHVIALLTEARWKQIKRVMREPKAIPPQLVLFRAAWPLTQVHSSPTRS